MGTVRRLWQALKENRARVAWAVVEGLIGAVMGLLMATLWLWNR